MYESAEHLVNRLSFKAMWEFWTVVVPVVVVSELTEPIPIELKM